MRNIIHTVIICFATFGFTNFALAEQNPTQQIISFKTPGNLESDNALKCVGAENLGSKFTPADLYSAVPICARQGKYSEGFFFIALAGTYGRFDTLRVSDKTAHQAVTVLLMQAFGDMTPDERDELQKIINKTTGNPDSLASTCQLIERIGPPTYYPRYMIQHGMAAFTSNSTDDGLVKDFDAAAAWKLSLNSYLHCH